VHPRYQGFDGKNYIDNLSEEVKKGMREKAEQGGFPGKVPVGCINNKETHLVEIDPQMAPFIRKLYQWYASGHVFTHWSSAQMCGTRFTTRQKKISRSNLEWILKNVFYTGNFYWKGHLYKGVHAAIVSDQLFQAVREAFNKYNKPRESAAETFLSAAWYHARHAVAPSPQNWRRAATSPPVMLPTAALTGIAALMPVQRRHTSPPSIVASSVSVNGWTRSTA
jgi:hypothetical protein